MADDKSYITEARQWLRHNAGLIVKVPLGLAEDALAAKFESIATLSHAAGRAEGLEEAAKAVELFRDKHRPVQPKKQRFDIYDIGHWTKAALTLATEDVRALASDPEAGAPAPAPGLAAQEVERLLAIETAAKVLLAAIENMHERGETFTARVSVSVSHLGDALSAPRPAQTKGGAE